MAKRITKAFAKTLAPIILKRVSKDEKGCFLWKGAVNGNRKGGYAIIRYGNRLYRCHRVIWVAHNGAIPRGKAILHRCVSARHCVNPEHLYAGTLKQNSQDCLASGNFKFNGAKLNLELAEKMRALKAQNFTYKELMRIFGVCESTISAVLRGETWPKK